MGPVSGEPEPFSVFFSSIPIGALYSVPPGSIDAHVSDTGLTSLHDHQAIVSSICRPVVLLSADSRGSFSTNQFHGVEGLPAVFVELCELHSGSTIKNNSTISLSAW